MKLNKSLVFLCVLGFGMLYLQPEAVAQSVQMSGISIDFGTEESADADYSGPIKVFALLTVLSLAPAILIALTAFTRIIIVLSMLRHGFGMPSTPPNTVLISLALFLTFYSMEPVYNGLMENAYQPYTQKEISVDQALDKASDELKRFLISQTREKDVALILKLSNREIPQSIAEVPLSVMAPAFMLSELQTAFQIGFVIFLPFLAVDLIVASILMSMGMIMLPPMTISLPIKILMFVLIEGWALVAQALIGSFQ